jgi:hypothetical protein
MEKIFCLLTGLVVGGLIVCALKFCMNHHANPVHRFAPEIKPADQDNEEPEEEVSLKRLNPATSPVTRQSPKNNIKSSPLGPQFPGPVAQPAFSMRVINELK